MTLSEVAVKRPVFIAMVTVAIMVMGVTGYTRLSTDLYPDVSFPFVSVIAIYPGASPSDIELQITKKIEDAVVAISGVEAVQSLSFDGYVRMFVQFELSKDLDKAANEVRERIAALKPQWPSGAKEPIVSRVDLGALPVITFAAGGKGELGDVRRIAEDILKPAFEQLDGVAEVRIKGGLEREVQILLNQAALQALRLSPLTVLEQVKAANLTIPGGKIEQAQEELSIRTIAEFRTIDEIANLVVATDPRGGQVRLRDVADVVDGQKDVRTRVRRDGEPAVAIEVVKQTGANTVIVARAIKERIEKLRPSFPDGFEVQKLFDSSIYIEANAHEVNIALWFGGLMAILIILLFMMDVRSTLISAVALPTSVVGAFYAMYLLGFSLNMMTLLGLSLAIGLLIDDAVVVRENIFKYLERGVDPHEAAIKGTNEVQLAVLATTLTICAVFVPVAFMDGLVGQFFRQFGLTICAAVLLSLWVAFTLDPMLSSRFSKKVEHGQVPGWAKPLRAMFAALDLFYARLLAGVLVRRKTTVLAAAAVFFGSMGILGFMGQDFLAPEDRAQTVVQIELPAGTSLDETARRTLELERAVLKLPHVKAVYAVIGVDEEANRAQWRVLYSPKEERRSAPLDQLKADLRGVLSGVENAKVKVLNPPNIEGLGDFQPIMLHVTGPDIDELRRISKRMVAAVAQIPGVAEVDSSLRPQKPDIRVEIDREALAHRGLQATMAGMAVRVAINGEEAGFLRTDSATSAAAKEVPIRVRLREADRKDPALISELTLPGFDLVKLGDVANITRGEAPSVIEHFGRQRRFLLSVTPAGRPLGDVVKDVYAKIDALHLPAGYQVHLDGDAKNQAESAAAMGVAFLLAFVFIYIVLAAQFESFVHPFTIMVSLPLALVGAVLALFLAGSAFSLSAMIGIILLMGLVTKNAILLVDSALQEQRDRGATPRDAIFEAGKKRLRPILMTSAAMVLGMLPTAFGSGAGSEFRGPMAIAVIGGVITSTVLTLVVVPVVFVWFEALVGVLKRPKGASTQEG
ncbi:MAG: efflux RND transporter permease subunit [Deltaproteobacteria bacterium]|nr:efflux RND transporter permease subunit [Deltaproteobacteria bacterium]